jgi:hypothetical protein
MVHFGFADEDCHKIVNVEFVMSDINVLLCQVYCKYIPTIFVWGGRRGANSILRASREKKLRLRSRAKNVISRQLRHNSLT